LRGLSGERLTRLSIREPMQFELAVAIGIVYHVRVEREYVAPDANGFEQCRIELNGAPDRSYHPSTICFKSINSSPIHLVSSPPPAWSQAAMVEMLRGASTRMPCVRHPERKDALEGTSVVIMASHRNGLYNRCRERACLCGSLKIEGEGLRFDVPVTLTRRSAFLPRSRPGVYRANGI